jgi:hypothetical protein
VWQSPMLALRGERGNEPSFVQTGCCQQAMQHNPTIHWIDLSAAMPMAGLGCPASHGRKKIASPEARAAGDIMVISRGSSELHRAQAGMSMCGFDMTGRLAALSIAYPLVAVLQPLLRLIGYRPVAAAVVVSNAACRFAFRPESPCALAPACAAVTQTSPESGAQRQMAASHSCHLALVDLLFHRAASAVMRVVQSVASCCPVCFHSLQQASA